MKKFFPLLLCLFIDGCATTQIVTEVQTWREPEVYVHIEKYVEEYGEPHVVVHGMNNMNGDEYLDLFWKIDDFWYDVQLYKDKDGWRITKNDFVKHRT